MKLQHAGTAVGFGCEMAVAATSCHPSDLEITTPMTAYKQQPPNDYGRSGSRVSWAVARRFSALIHIGCWLYVRSLSAVRALSTQSKLSVVFCATWKETP